MAKVIDKFDGEYDFLSNFYVDNFRYCGTIYKSVEHFFQSAKACNKADWDLVVSRPGAGSSKRAGRKIACRKDWDEIKDNVMELALVLKFQNKMLREKLLNTGDYELIEGNNWGDTYWGVCEGIGKNRLGELLMKIRDDLKGENTF